MLLLKVNFILALFQLSGDNDEKKEHIKEFRNYFMKYFD